MNGDMPTSLQNLKRAHPQTLPTTGPLLSLVVVARYSKPLSPMNSFSIYTTINSSININMAFLKTIPPALTYSNPSMTGPSPYPIVNVLLSAMLTSHAPLIPFPIQNSSQNSRVTASRAIFFSGSSHSSLIDPNRFV